MKGLLFLFFSILLMDLITIALFLSPLSTAVDPTPEVGSAAWYDAPYTPNACKIGEEHLAPDGLYAAVDEGLWNKTGNPCGSKVQVRCIEGPDTCHYGTNLTATITDRLQQMVSEPSSFDVRLVLSKKAYGSIADSSRDSIKVQFQLL
ncbi:hypothetical protein SLEP1_g27090 [Rubroshorea leprosula]|uniref:Expansin-like EG45 domain-containing protein n=1 Tax=Rubroshorea leprosula TaxID=152421 RepID=A0AAV5K1U9_9ROSI|nr:hypothetical protein SLEP1_g27090 [Rubroshorea leprosula]